MVSGMRQNIFILWSECISTSHRACFLQHSSYARHRKGWKRIFHLPSQVSIAFWNCEGALFSTGIYWFYFDRLLFALRIRTWFSCLQVRHEQCPLTQSTKTVSLCVVFLTTENRKKMDDVLMPIVYIFISQAVLQRYVTVMREHPSWSVAHIAADLSLVEAFSNEKVKQWVLPLSVDKNSCALYWQCEKTF